MENRGESKFLSSLLKKRWVKIFIVYTVIKTILLIVAWFYLPVLAVRYLNRPDTDIRKKLSESVSAALGEPVHLEFIISRGKMSLPMDLDIQLSDVALRSKTVDPLGITVRSAEFNIPLIKCIRYWRLDIRRVTIHVPSIHLSPVKWEGREVWPMQALIPPPAPADTPEAGGASSGSVPFDIRNIDIEIDSVHLRMASDFEWERISQLKLSCRRDAVVPVRMTLVLTAGDVSGWKSGIRVTAIHAPHMSQWHGTLVTDAIDLRWLAGLLGRQDIAQIDGIEGTIRPDLRWCYAGDSLLIQMERLPVKQFVYPVRKWNLKVPELHLSGDITVQKGSSPYADIVAAAASDRIRISGELKKPLDLAMKTVEPVYLERLGLVSILTSQVQGIGIENPTAAFDIRLTGHPDAPDVSGTYELKSSRMTYRGIPLDKPEVSGRITPSRVDGSIRGILFSGKVESTFSGPSSLSPMDLRLKLTGAELAGINPLLPTKAVKMAGRAELSADLKSITADVRTLTGVVQFGAGGVEVTGLPTLSTLSESLNDIAAVLSKFGEGDWKAMLSKVNDATTAAVTSKGSTRFDRVQAGLSLAGGAAQLSAVDLSNSELAMRVGGRIGLAAGELDLQTGILFTDASLQKIRSRYVRDVLAGGVKLPVRGTLMKPQFDKDSFLKPLVRDTGRKIMEDKLGNLLKKFETR